MQRAGVDCTAVMCVLICERLTNCKRNVKNLCCCKVRKKESFESFECGDILEKIQWRSEPPKKVNISYATLSRGISWNVPRVTCIFLLCILAFWLFYVMAENTVTNTINATYAPCTMGRLEEIPSNKTAFLYWLVEFFIAWHKDLYIDVFYYIIMVNSRFYISTFQRVNTCTSKNTDVTK